MWRPGCLRMLEARWATVMIRNEVSWLSVLRIEGKGMSELLDRPCMG
jgi:hypothetical protein